MQSHVKSELEVCGAVAFFYFVVGAIYLDLRFPLISGGGTKYVHYVFRCILYGRTIFIQTLVCGYCPQSKDYIFYI